jgi:hypothetical protein
MEEGLSEDEKNAYYKIVHLLQTSELSDVANKEEEILDYLDNFPGLILISKLKFNVYLNERINDRDMKTVKVLRAFENFFKAEVNDK